MALDILHDNWGPYTHTEVENALKAILQELAGKANTALQPENIAAWAKAQNKPGYTVSEITYSNLLTLAEKLADMDQKIQDAAASGGVDPDDEMSATSEKPVQNKVIKAFVEDFVSQAISNLVNGAPETLDTLRELAEALDDNDDAVVALTTAIAAKISGIKVNGTLQTPDTEGNVNIVVDGVTEQDVEDMIEEALEDIGGGTVESVTINGVNHEPLGGIVDLGTIVGEKGEKGDTGNVEFEDLEDLVALLVNDLDTGGAGNFLSAEMGKRLVTKMGSFGEAWVWSNTFPYPFTWILNDTINGANIKKPIYHIGNGVFIDSVGAVVMLVAAEPSIPEFSIADNSQVNKNAPLSISFDAGSILHYKVNSGETQIATASPAVINLTTACTIEAWAENAAGTSSHRSRSYTIAAPADPTFDTASGELVYGTSINISFGAGLTLYYRINSGSWATTQQSPLTLAIESATNIDAYASDGDNVSNTISRAYTIAAPSAPTFDTDSSELDFGTQISIAWASGVLKYTINSGTTQTASTSPLAIAITEGMTIEAWAEQGGLQSTHVTKTYTLAPQAMKITASEATTVDINGTTYNLSEGVNRLALTTLDQSGDNEIASIAFTDNTKITAFDGGGATFTGTSLTFFASASNLVSFTNLATTEDLVNIVIGGCGKLEVFDTSRFAPCMLAALNDSTLGGCFRSLSKLNTLDLSMCAVASDKSWRVAFEKSSGIRTLKIGKWDKPSQITNMMYLCGNITTLVCSSEEVPICAGTGSWLDPDVNNSLQARNVAFQTGGNGVVKVPASKVNDYKAAPGWSNLADFIVANDE